MQQPAPTETTALGEFLPLLIAAVFSLAIAWCVQLYIVPKVEARKRREDRWERDLLELGRLLAFDADQLFGRLYLELSWESDLAQRSEPAEPGAKLRFQALKEDHRQALHQVATDVSAFHRQARWLADRVASIDSGNRTLWMLPIAATSLEHSDLVQLLPMWRVADGPPDEDTLKAASADNRERLKKFVDRVTELAAGPPPRSHGAVYNFFRKQLRKPGDARIRRRRRKAEAATQTVPVHEGVNDGAS